MFKNKLVKFLFNIKTNGARNTITFCGLKFSYIDKIAKYQRLLNVYNLHSKVFPKYKNCNEGKDIVILATGPSLREFKPIDNAVYIGVNRAFEFDKVKLDYVFIMDNSNPTPEYLEELNKYEGNNVKKFYGICSDYDLMSATISENDAIKAKAERFYIHTVRDKKIPTYDISTEAFFNSGSIVFPAIQFALWTNPKRIYIVGCDTNLSGYYKGNKNILNVKKVLDGWKQVKEFVQIYYPNTEIVSVNPVGLKGLFKDVFTK